jgi:hypothetical protein
MADPRDSTELLPADDLIIGAPKFSAWSGLPETTVRKLVREGRLPVIRLPGEDGTSYSKLMFRKSSFLKLLDQLEAASMQPRPESNGANGAPTPEPPPKRRPPSSRKAGKGGGRHVAP